MSSFEYLTHEEKELAAKQIIAARSWRMQTQKDAEKIVLQRLQKRKTEEDAAYRKKHTTEAALLDAARDEAAYRVTARPSLAELATVDAPAAELRKAMEDAQQSLQQAENAAAAARLELERAQKAFGASHRTYEQLRYLHTHAVHDGEVRALIAQTKAKFEQLNPVAASVTVLPHFVATTPTQAESVCGCIIQYAPAHRYESDWSEDSMGHSTGVGYSMAPAACHHRLCMYHRNIFVIPPALLCRLFCTEMAAAGCPVPEHDQHAYIKDTQYRREKQLYRTIGIYDF